MSESIEVPLDGVLTTIERRRIALKEIIFDETNPRIQYHLDTSLTDDVTQDKLEFALAEGNDQYEKLREHIEVNGGVYNAIWVVPEGGAYRVVEGNTRLAVYRELREKYVTDPRWQSIDSWVLPRAVDRHKINFIRLENHLFGPTPWDAYEKARELHRLYYAEDYSIQRLAKLTKLSPSNIKTNIEAFADMESQYIPRFNRPSERLKFSYFAEFHKSKDLRRLVNDGSISLLDFCDIVGQGKLGRGEDVRRLAEVWRDDDARTALLDDDMEAALEQLAQRRPGAKYKLFEKMAEVSEGLRSMPFEELMEIKNGLQPAKVRELKALHDVLVRVLRDIGGQG